ncbi:hypothetical protein [Methanoculleus sp.]|uniref:hypothetical protein n=1 Tax=Methanoculleus sp. TaxID=90427 RepID=UPI0025EA6887|nr:hypothetical protein [Methanoculleus sp.]MCK9319369.1 hypothetical protein [Methanoculleus sp.]
MASAKSTKLKAEQKQKDQLLLSLGYAKWIPRVIMVPTIFYKKIAILYETVFKDATTITAFTSYIFQIGIDLFWQLKGKFGVNSFGEFLRIREFLFDNLNEVMRMYYKDEVLTTLEAVNGARSVLKKKNDTEQAKFLEFVKKHRKRVLNGRVLLRTKDFLILDRLYRRLNKRYVTHQITK